jgi:uncharacterized membrane protein YhdT
MAVSMRFLPLISSLTSLILSILANARCNLIKPNIWDMYYPEWETNAPDTIGLWCYQDNGGQTVSLESTSKSSYDTYFQVARGFGTRWGGGDTYLQVARGLGTTVLVLGSLFMIVYLVAAVKHSLLNGEVYLVLGVACILTCCLFQGLVFLIFKTNGCSEFGCSLGTGGKIGIVACVGWFLTGIASMMMMLVGIPAKEDIEEPADEGGEK